MKTHMFTENVFCFGGAFVIVSDYSAFIRN